MDRLQNTERTPEAFSELLQQFTSTLSDIQQEKISELAGAVNQQLAGLAGDHLPTIHHSLCPLLVTYVERGLELTSVEVLASLTKRTRARIEGANKRNRDTYIRSTLNLVASLSKSNKVQVIPLAKEEAKQALERCLDAFFEYLINRLADDTDHQGNDDEQEPINIQIRRKAAILRDYGYVMALDGLHSVYVVEIEGEKVEKFSLIAKLYVDVLTKRHIYTVPESLTEKPKEQGVVLEALFSPIENRKISQTIEIHRSDMLARQPKFLEQIQVGVPPHKRKRDDFIHALEAMAMAAPIEKRYNATGLIKDIDTLVFLNPSGGGITTHGIEERYQVQFPLNISSRLTSIRYGWERTSSSEELIPDYCILLRTLNIAPGSIGYGDVLLGTLGFAPMSQTCSTGGVWSIIHGLTGSMKSASSRLLLQAFAVHFFGRQETSTINLREGASTAYAIEQVLYYLAGVFAHLDDGLKGNNVSQKDVEKFYKLLSTIGGHAVTKQGGKRGIWGQGEGGFGIEPYPRCSGVYTVETLPASEGHASDLARYIVVSLDGAGLVDEQLLTELQDKDAAAAMNRVTASYIQWLLPRLSKLDSSIAEKEETYRKLGIHSRTPTSFAKLETGLSALFRFGVAIGAHTDEQATALLDACRERLSQVALRQKALMGIDEQQATANDATHIFYRLLYETMRPSSRRLYVSDAAYRGVEEYNSEGDVSKVIGHRPQPPLFLADESLEHGLNPMPDSWGWKYNEMSRIYEGAGTEAGVLKWDGVKPVLLMYVRDFKEVVYKELDKLAKSQEIPLPGVNEMILKLKEKQKLTSMPNNTHLHGRNSRSAGVYILDMTPEPETPETVDEEPNTELGYIISETPDGQEVCTFDD